MTKGEVRKDIYKLFEELSGKTMTAQQHDALKLCINSYIEVEHNELVKALKAMEEKAQKMAQMAKIIYQRGWDAEILEKHIGFLKKLFDQDEKINH